MTTGLEPDDLPLLSIKSQQIIRNAGLRIMAFFNHPMRIEFKSRFDMVTEADRASENFIIEALQALTPDISILAEESCGDNIAKRLCEDWIWVLDPLDGTTNFAHGFPHFAISLALVKAGKPIIGLVFDPVRDEMFTSIRGTGSFLNSNPLIVSSTDTLERSLLATGFPYQIRELKQNNLVEFCAFRLESQGIRRFGAAALDLAYVATGRLDGFWERWLKPWDTAAGILLITEAGGRITRFDGSDYCITDCNVVASNGSIHETMLQVLNQSLPELPDFPRLRQ